MQERANFNECIKIRENTYLFIRYASIGPNIGTENLYFEYG
jgi:hypothetical protein